MYTTTNHVARLNFCEDTPNSNMEN
uniref:Uncharacterized protein n=1 Tax=Arundo donax TaxID=35708 RepID=A0A0A9GSI0_ARUDO